ncbi:uncharacterized protein LOC128865324 [Anastrepha ludens]|uniref:uncharacterized protein LOC128865324 n=1 Tax=Anastrepha ludens TaxID=28586 RepID=UPI0023AEE260|nr:uncharacterized protein LOC128865324 [Anastrepha ludens]
MFSLEYLAYIHSIFWSSMILTLSVLQLLPFANAHFIQIDHNAFQLNNFPRPPLLPPPLPPIKQIPRHLGSVEVSPAELMADLSNALAYRILHYHSILNRNNFAFSPTALMSVLIALYEGSAGRSALELRNVLLLPNSRDIIRIGYRDIHRRLRTYFFGSENPLKGLSLNKENVTITHSYETVLMFYGYDLGIDMVSSTVSMPSPSTPVSNITDEIAMATTTIMPEIVTTKFSNFSTATTSEAELMNGANTTPSPAMLTTTSESTTIAEKPNETTTIASQITTSAEVITTAEVTTPPQITTPAETTVTSELSTITVEDVTTETNDETTPTPIKGNENDVAELVAPIELNSTPFQRLQKAHPIHQPSSKLQAPLSLISAPKHKYLPQTARSRSIRHKRHLFSLKEVDTNLFVTLFPQQHHTFPSQHTTGPATLGQFTNEYEVETLDAQLLNVANAKSNYGYNTDVISHVFYLGNQQLVHTTFKVYNAVLYFKYFEELKMSVLELELDTPDYNLMILLPDYQIDLVTATASLGLAPSLRLMRKQLKPKWVQAIIPDFKLHGILFLTNDLQNMGVCDIFEPIRADFRPMTDEKGIYVKHIEQSINVNIRTHPINQLKRNYGSQTQPIQISVNHPFLFFVIDRDLDVAVMSGRILNPLNVRIQ